MNAFLSHPLTWGAPLWLWALAILPFLVALFAWAEHRRIQLLQRLVAPRLQPLLAGNLSLGKRRLHFALILGALACFLVALAQPRYGYISEEAKRKGRDVLIVYDNLTQHAEAYRELSLLLRRPPGRPPDRCRGA